MNHVENYVQTGKTFGSSKVTLISGKDDLSEPIGVKLLPIYEAFNFGYYQNVDQPVLQRCNNPFSESRLKAVQRNIRKILTDYPKLLHVFSPVGKDVCCLKRPDNNHNSHSP